MPKSLTEMAQEIVQAQASAKQMTMEEITSSLQETFNTLKILQANEAGGVEAEAAGEAASIPEPKKSIRKNGIICLECGQEFKMLSAKHLASHELDAKSYRTKYGFSARQPLCAKSVSDRRSASGKDRGLPENLRKYLDARSAKKREREAAVQGKSAARPQADAAGTKVRVRRNRKAQPTETQE